MKRIPEPEVMDDVLEAESYASEAALAYLSRIDDTFVERFLRIGLKDGLVLDLGSGPGVIPIKIALKCKGLEVLGVDLSEAMLQIASKNLQAAGLGSRVRFARADAKRLDFPDCTFDAVISNSLLHHLQDPRVVLVEAARVLKPGGVVLIRDIRRPPAFLLGLWVRVFGRYYSGKMLEAYARSLRAALSFGELKSLLRSVSFAGCTPFWHGLTHIGVERRAFKA